MTARSKTSQLRIARNYVGRQYLLINAWIWNHLPVSMKSLPSLTRYGGHIQSLVQLRGKAQSTGTFFFRNRPELELLIRLLFQFRSGLPVDIAILGCSKGAEVYSFSYAIRTQRPDLKHRLLALDICKDVVDFAEAGAYSLEAKGGSGDESPVSLGRGGDVALMTSKDQRRSIFERMSLEDMDALFERGGEEVRVRPRFRERISWRVGDASDARLIEAVGLQDIVVANRFLCHMPPAEAEACLRNLVRLVKSGGYLFVSGVDLAVRSKVARELGWKPVTELIDEIHEGDTSLRRGWPLQYWGLEPLDRGREDWEIRYASVFQMPAPVVPSDSALAQF
jgi:chemotaxis methyl-accepting protein methylase